MKTKIESTEKQVGEITSLSVLGARLTWVFIGPLVLFLSGWGIVSSGKGWLTAYDLLFVLVVGWIILARWFEQRSGSAATLDGQAVTAAYFTRYVRALLGVSGLIWIAANVVGNHVLG